MGLFGGDSKSTSQQTAQDASSNAGAEGSVAVNESVNLSGITKSNVSITTLDGAVAQSAIEAATESGKSAINFAENALESAKNAYGVAGTALDFGQALTEKTLKANQDLANNFRDLAEGAHTTLRDTLSVALNSEQLAGKASASTAPSTKVTVAVVAVIFALGLLFASFVRPSRPAPSRKNKR